MASRTINSYPKIYNLGHKYIQNLLSEIVIVEEKIDGSQLSFGLFDGELYMRSRGQMINIDNPEGMFEIAVEKVKEIQHLLERNWIYRGEYLRKPKHNSLCYGRVPKNNIILFDIMRNRFTVGNITSEDYLVYPELQKEATRLGFECVPLFYEGRVHNIEQLDTLLERGSILGNVAIEGVVVKSNVLWGKDGKPMMGKYVSPKFRELHSKEWKKANPGAKDIKAEIATLLNPEARWEKAVQHLKEKGELENSPRDIGNLMKEISIDTREETEEHIKDLLFKWAWKDINRNVTRGFPEWYKRKLLEGAFD